MIGEVSSPLFFLGRHRREVWPLFFSLSNTFQLEIITMKKLLDAYRKLPSPSNRTKLQTYLNKHMMAVCMALPEDIAFLKAHNFTI